MYIDIGIGVIVVVFALMGLLSGFWGQILRLAALVSLFFLAPPVAKAIQGPVADTLGTQASPQMVWGISLIVAAVLLYIAMSIIIAIILHSAGAYRRMGGANRIAGLFLGLVKGLVLAYVLASGLAMVTHAGQMSHTVETQASESHVVKLVAKYNLFEKMGYSYEEIVSTITQLGREGSGEGTGAPVQPEAPATQAQVPPTQPMIPPTVAPSMPPVQQQILPPTPATQGVLVPVMPVTTPSQGLPTVPPQPGTIPPTVRPIPRPYVPGSMPPPATGP